MCNKVQLQSNMSYGKYGTQLEHFADSKKIILHVIHALHCLCLVEW